ALGTEVKLKVTPASGFQFVRWEGPNATDVEGTYPEFQIKMNSNKSLTAVFDRIPVFSEDFDDITDWTKTGLWHVCDDPCFGCGRLTGKYAHYAKIGTCSYDTGTRTMGTLTSPAITIPSNALLTLQFDFARQVEYYTRSVRDRTYVQIRFGYMRTVRGRPTLTWSGWRTIWARSSRDKSPECGTFFYNFNSGRYTYMQVMFVFDSVNRDNNNFAGWAIDNLIIKPAGGLQSTALEVADLGLGWEEPKATDLITVVNTPNPVRDVHTTTFTVLGVEAETLRVEVYDLTGRLVWKAEAEGNELVWHTEDPTGLPLANGVYIYIAYVKVDGEWIKMEPQKLVILR
ncbi:MAG: T9SS type A sorting domain-containing protein, partial [Candidatus Bipolaricaulaceae bacterium]